MLKKMSYLLVCLFVVGLCAANSLAAGASWTLAEDNFDDNSRNTAIWPNVYTGENGVITETNQRLEYTSTGAPSDENIAHYALGLDLAYNSTWTAEVDVHVGDYGLAVKDHTYAIELSVHSPNATGDSAIFFELARGKDENSNSYFHWAICNEYGPGDNDEEFWTNPAGNTDGSMTLVWNENGNHKFRAYYMEPGDSYPTELTEDDGFDLNDWDWGTTTPEERYFNLGLGGYDEGTGQALTDGSKLYADDFNLVPEPMTLSLLAFGGLVTLIRRKR